MDKKIILTSLIISLSIMSSKNLVSNDKAIELQNESRNGVSVEIYNGVPYATNDPGDYWPE